MLWYPGIKLHAQKTKTKKHCCKGISNTTAERVKFNIFLSDCHDLSLYFCFHLSERKAIVDYFLSPLEQMVTLKLYLLWSPRFLHRPLPCYGSFKHRILLMYIILKMTFSGFYYSLRIQLWQWDVQTLQC